MKMNWKKLENLKELLREATYEAENMSSANYEDLNTIDFFKMDIPTVKNFVQDRLKILEKEGRRSDAKRLVICYNRHLQERKNHLLVVDVASFIDSDGKNKDILQLGFQTIKTEGGGSAAGHIYEVIAEKGEFGNCQIGKTILPKLPPDTRHVNFSAEPTTEALAA
jgi:hypothetical protein